MPHATVNVALVLLAAMGGAPSAGSRLRRSRQAAPPAPAASSAALLARRQEPIDADTDMEAHVGAIHEKWDKMGDFMEIMFMLACKAKHGQDVNGLTQEKLKNEDITGDEVRDFKKQTQKTNMQMLNSACGSIVAKGESPCRQRCADGYGANMVKRSECDDKCVLAYSTFERNCRAKAGNLASIYKMKNDIARSRERCHEGHCAILPTVWMKAEEEQEAAVTAGCAGRCTADYIQATCEKDFALNLDFAMGDIKQGCFDDSGFPACYDEKAATVEKEVETCDKDGLATCETQHGECSTSAEGQAPEAMAFCDERKSMCEEQVTNGCVKANKQGLDKAARECEEENKEELKTCEDEALATKETEDVEACVAEDGPKCQEDCASDCNVVEMNECLGNLETSDDATEMFCSDFWHLLHDSSEVDPSTGNPIVLLAPKANITKANVTLPNTTLLLAPKVVVAKS